MPEPEPRPAPPPKPAPAPSAPRFGAVRVLYVLCGLFAFAAIGVKLAGRAAVDRDLGPLGAAPAPKDASDATDHADPSISALTQQAQAVSAAAAAVTAPPAASGLDLLRGPSESDAYAPQGAPSPSAAPQGGPAPALAASVQAMQANAAGMLDALTPMLNMLQSSSKMGPQQKADVKELQGLMQELKTQMVSGKRMDDAVFKEKMIRYQTLLMKVMANSAPASAAPAR
ncbi:MAG: hypothetical protein ACHQ2Z_02025 [Elusimicrobiota bacterium]